MDQPIFYIEPNDLEFNNEDLNIGVYLEIENVNRALNEENETQNAEVNVKSSYINLMKGADGILTTDYSDVGVMEIYNGGNKESLGIESINIKYSSWFYPEVDIKFVDVRGNSVFSSMESSNDPDKKGDASFMESFFKFPYPIFKLTVKGQYGSPVTFKLTVRDVRSTFNSSTGNYEIMVKFIGYMYGYLTDIPMQYLLISPDIKYDGCDDNLGNFSTGEGEIPDLIEFFSIVTETLNAINNDKDLGEVNSAVEALGNKLKFAEKLRNHIIEIKNNKFLTITETSDKETSVFNFSDSEDITDNDKETTVNTINTALKTLSTNKNKYNKDANFETVFFFKNTVKNISITDLENGCELFYKKEDIDVLSSIITNINNEINTKSETRKRQITDAFSENLGWKPTVKNMVEMILAHLRKFHDNMEKCMGDIRNNSHMRNLNGITGATTDCNSNANDITAYPFTGFFDKDEQYLWLGEPGIGGNVNSFNEIDLVERILGATKESNDKMEEVEERYDALQEMAKFPKYGIPTMFSDLENTQKPYYFDKKENSTKFSGDELPLVIRKFIIRAILKHIHDNDSFNYESWKEFGRLEGLNLFGCGYNDKRFFEDEGWTSSESGTLKKIQEYILNDAIITELICNATDFSLNSQKYIDGTSTEKRPPYCIKNDNNTYYVSEGTNDVPNYNEIINDTYNVLISQDFEVSNEYKNRFPQTSNIPLKTILPYEFKLLVNGNKSVKEGVLSLDEKFKNSLITVKGYDDLLKKIVDKKDYILDICQHTNALGVQTWIVNENNEVIIEENEKLQRFFEILLNQSLNRAISSDGEVLNYIDVIKVKYESLLNKTGIFTIPKMDVMLIGYLSELNKSIGIYLYQDKLFPKNEFTEECEKRYNEFKDEFIKLLVGISKQPLIVEDKNGKIEYVSNNFNVLRSLFEDTETFFIKRGNNIQNNFRDVIKNNETNSFIKYAWEGFSEYINEKFFQTEGTTDETYVFADNSEKLSVYLTLKDIYDRWKFGANRLKGNSDKNQDFLVNIDNFVFRDTLNNDIGDILTVDPFEIINLIRGITGNNTTMSAYSFIWEICKHAGLTLTALPVNVYESFKTKENMEKVFTPVQYFSGYGNSMQTTYIATYAYRPSQHLNFRTSQSDYKDDGVDFEKDYVNPKVVKQKDNDKHDKTMSAFAVTYGMGNQRIFKNINVSMDKPQVTEQSLRSTLYIAQQGNTTGIMKKGFTSQNTFDIYSNHAYTCKVEMLGCAQLMPMMYFQLNNVPMFKGGYQIISVEHNIKSGEMTTSFTGVRINRHHFNHTDELGKYIDNDNILSGGSNGSGRNNTNSKKSNANSSELNDNFIVRDTKFNKKTTKILFLAGHYMKTPGKQSPKVIETDFFNEAPGKEDGDVMTPYDVNGNETYRYREYYGNRKVLGDILVELKKRGFPSENIIRLDTLGKNSKDQNNYTERITDCYNNNNGNCIVICLHSNASAVPKGDNEETYWGGGNYWCVYRQSKEKVINKNTFVSPTHPDISETLAYSLIKGMKQSFENNSKILPVVNGETAYVKDTPLTFTESKDGYRGLTYSKAPAVLTENLFHNTKSHVKMLGTAEGRNVIVQGICNGIEQFFVDIS